VTATAAGALEGVRVLDFTHFLAGQYAALTLADLGADVVRVEDADRPDHARAVGPHHHHGHSLYFLSLNWGKRSVALRLSNPRSRGVLDALVRTADVVLDNYRPGVMAKLGLDHDSLVAVNPRIVSCSLTGYGETGPYSRRPGYDYTIQALSGVMSLTGDPDAPPGKAGISYVDHSTALAAALAICAALVERARTGRGRHVDVGLLDVQVSMLSYLGAWQQNAGDEPRRYSDASHPSLVPAQNFRARDEYIAVFVGNDAMWQRLVAAVADDRLGEERFATMAARNESRAEVVALLAELFATRDADEWVTLLNENGVACSQVNTVSKALADEQVQARGLVQSAEHPAYGSYLHVAGPVPTMGTAGASGAPLLGQHTESIMRALGYEPEAIAELAASGAIVVA
jgi:crotonobetainyl-CoA:carnitine CoA-transferase CaiB-like acyl-CoA transferase